MTVHGDRQRRPPVIGVCAALERGSWGPWVGELADFVPHSYVNALQKARALVVLLPPDAGDSAHPSLVLGMLDGLLLAGGADIDPSFYGADQVPGSATADLRRDEFEIDLARTALNCDLPVLGICRGMQILNVATGGTLIQHLPDLVEHGDHQVSPGVFNEHVVRVAPSSRVAAAVGVSGLTVSSLHHQGVDRLGSGAEPSGWSELDDVIEAIEFPACRFGVGVLWHPEQQSGVSPLLRYFVEAASGFEGALQRDPSHRRGDPALRVDVAIPVRWGNGRRATCSRTPGAVPAIRVP